MQALTTNGAVRADSSTGTAVSLVVPGQAPPPHTTPGHTRPGHTTPGHTPPHHIPFTGFELVPVLAAAALLVAAGTLLARLGRRSPQAAPAPSSLSPASASLAHRRTS